MRLPSRSFIAAFAIGGAAIIGYFSLFTAVDSEIDTSSEQSTIAELQASEFTEDTLAAHDESARVPAAGATVSPTITADTVSKWTADACNEDPQTRAAAINALATAPKLLAVPALQKLLGTGAEEDRQLALNALRALALKQGDADGEIRSVLRLTLYDGDNEMVAIDAQATLDELDQMVANQGS